MASSSLNVTSSVVFFDVLLTCRDFINLNLRTISYNFFSAFLLSFKNNTHTHIYISEEEIARDMTQYLLNAKTMTQLFTCQDYDPITSESTQIPLCATKLKK